ncbi:MAG: TolC family protein [Desulfuromonadaceae bacterium]|nr:TolC family protein [Desulfuromonadaceae bacterium]
MYVTAWFSYKYLTLLLALIVLLGAGCSVSPSYPAYSPAQVRAEYAHIPATVSPSGVETPAPLLAGEGIATSAPPAGMHLKGHAQTELKYPLSLPRVLQICMANNPNLQQTVERVAQAQAMQELAGSPFWPTVSFYTDYMQGNAPSDYLFKVIDQRKLPPNVDFNDPGWFENFETGLNARVNLFNAGRDYLGTRIATEDLYISELERQEIRNNLKAQAITAFYDVLSAQEFVDIAAASVETVAEQLRITQVQYDGGGALKADVLTLKVRLAQAEEVLVESKKRYALAKATLVHLMGLDPGENSPELVLTPQTAEIVFSVPETYEDGVIYAFEHRPELEKMRRMLVKSRMGVDVSKAGYLPQVDVLGKYYVDDPHMKYDLERENWRAMVLFNWELFSGFSTRAQVKKADAVVRQMVAADREAALNVKLEVQNAYLELEAARARYAVAVNSVASAEESYRLVSEYYRGGAVTLTRYLGAELDRNRARIHLSAAFYAKIKANAEYARAIGMLADNFVADFNQ